MKKERLDDLLLSRGLAPTKSRAQALILAGKVCVGEHRRDKPGERFPEDASIRVTTKDQWASRGAHKLLGAFEAFQAARVDFAQEVAKLASTSKMAQLTAERTFLPMTYECSLD